MNPEPEKFDLIPEETWPEASLLLDRHFARKRRKKRLLIFFLLAGLIGAGSWWIFSPTEQEESSVVIPVKSVLSDESTPSVISQVNNQVRQGTKAETQPPPARSNTNLGSSSPSPNPSSPVAVATTAIATSSAWSMQRVPAAGVTTPVASSISVQPTLIRASHDSSYTSESIEKSAITSAAEITSSMEWTTGSSKLTEQNMLAAGSSSSNTSKDSLTSTEVLPAWTLDSGTANAAVSATSPDGLNVSTPFSESNSSDSAAHDMKQLPSVSSVQPDSLARTVSWSLEIYGGAVHSEKFLAAKDNSWVDRRQREEEAAVVPVFGLSVSMQKSHWSAGIGMELVQWGENTSYSPSTYQQLITDQSYWTYRIDSTDTAYISGNQYFQLDPSPTYYDSTLSPVFDTTYGFAADPRIAASNGPVRWRYLEFPVSLGYAFSAGRWRWTLTGALAPSLLITTSGKYLAQDQSGAVPVVEIASTRTIGMSTRLGLDFGYTWNRRWEISLCPQWRRQWFSSFTDRSAVDQRYRGLGVTAGIRYHLFH